MNRNTWILVSLAVVLAVLYLFGFTDLGRHRPIQISVASRPFAPNAGPGDILPLVFGLDTDRALTDVKVLQPQTNGGPATVLWELHSKRGSAPVRGFVYGETLVGMEAVGKSAPVPLEPGVTYHVEVREGASSGGVDFVPRPAAAP